MNPGCLAEIGKEMGKEAPFDGSKKQKKKKSAKRQEIHSKLDI
jgi:hypothetical protein